MKTNWIALLLVLPLLAGCGNTVTVQGTVVYDGNPVEDGHINFVPVDGQGPSGGAPIKNGKYRLAGLLTPGNYKVHFSGNRMVPAATDARLPSNLKPGDLIPIGDLIPDEAVGNFQVVEISGANGALNFDLNKPAP